MKTYRSPGLIWILTALYRPLGSLLAAPWTRMMQAAFCSRGKHSGGTHYCIYGCGTLINPSAPRRWSVSLHDGATTMEVVATNETQARCLVAFGESFYNDAIAKELYLIDPDNIRNCVAGELVNPSNDL